MGNYEYKHILIKSDDQLCAINFRFWPWSVVTPPTGHFIISEPRNREIADFSVVQECRTIEYVYTKMLKRSVGRESVVGGVAFAAVVLLLCSLEIFLFKGDWSSDRQTDRQTGRQTDWQTDWQTGRQTAVPDYISRRYMIYMHVKQT